LMILQGAWPPLIILGIVTTTISAASGCMIGAPRVFQALSADNLFPFLKFFAESHGEHRLPYRAYVLTFIITCAIILIELITNFFLAAFAIMNFACFDASAARSPGFRPGISWYNKNLSLGGAILCVIMMFVFSWKLSLVAFGIFAALYIFIKNRKKSSKVNWGSSHQANRYRKVLSNVLKLTHSEQHVKNYRPQILVLTGNPAARQVLVDFADCITKGTNLLICGHVVPYPSLVGATVIAEKLKERYTQWLHDHKIKAFYCAVSQTSLRAGVQILLQNAGVGKMQPNILLIGYKDTWLSQFEEGKMAELHDYWGVINDAFASNLSICIFRNGNEGLDTSGYITDETDKFFLKLPQMSITKFSPLADDLSRGIKKKQHRPKASNMKLDTIRPRPIRQSTMDALSNVMHRTPSGNLAHVPSEGSFGGHPSNQHQKVNMKFRNRIKDGVVDVWWLYDDGGLTWLLAYLLTTHPSFVEDAKLRVFTTCPRNASPEKVQENVEHMLKKFRITFKEVTVIVYEERELYPETQDEYNDIIEVINADSENPGISEEILKENEMRTRRFMLQREYLLEHSSASDLVIMTLPVASTSIVMSPLYNLWLEMLSRDMPPMLFIRGNHTSVMTLDS
uniref:Solute carrier family 12 member 2 n=1 Tax=Acrobeloides nanus TaxID=290746 RepID=A0A914CU74_9BILA